MHDGTIKSSDVCTPSPPTAWVQLHMQTRSMPLLDTTHYALIAIVLRTSLDLIVVSGRGSSFLSLYARIFAFYVLRIVFINFSSYQHHLLPLLHHHHHHLHPHHLHHHQFIFIFLFFYYSNFFNFFLFFFIFFDITVMA